MARTREQMLLRDKTDEYDERRDTLRQQDRQTFVIPHGYRAVRDAEGRATGEVEPDPEYKGDAFQVEGNEPAIDMAGLDAAVDSAMNKSFVARELEEKAALFEQRNALYGNNYLRFGPIMSQMLAGQTLDCNDPKVMNRIGIFVQITAKMTRYGNMFTAGGHDDSLDDISVYAMMLKQIDNET